MVSRENLKKLALIDLGVCNIGSLAASVSRLGAHAVVVSEPSQLNSVDRIILPGVGQFGTASKRLTDRGFVAALPDMISKGVPFLGICLGMQLMASSGHEGGVFSGLSILQGVVKEMRPTANTRIPHVGWNSVSFLSEHPVLKGIPNNSDFYFVHGFEVQDYSPDTLIGTATHGNEFPAVLGLKNAIGVQFHPEKSQAAGALLLSNFLGWDGDA